MSLFRKYGESLLDQPIGIEESRVRQKKEAEARGEMQKEKRNQRVARRAYRHSLRNGDFRGAMDALDWIDNKSGGLNPGIMQSGVQRGMAELPAGNGLLPPGGNQAPNATQWDSDGNGTPNFIQAPGNPAWDGDGNGVPNSLQAPGVASTQPSTHQPYNPRLAARIGLFGELKHALATGGDLGAIQRRATDLGIDSSGLNAGYHRAERELGYNPSLDSPSLANRLSAFSGKKSNLFSRNLSFSV